MAEIVTEEMRELRHLITQTVAKRDILKKEMEAWYSQNTHQRFEYTSELITIDSTLSQLDSHYKRLWDYHNAKSIAS